MGLLVSVAAWPDRGIAMICTSVECGRLELKALAVREGGSVTCDTAIRVRSVLAGDRAAYGTLYDRYADLVRAICHDTTRDMSETVDLSQEVFLRAYERLADLRSPERFGCWLAAIARSVCGTWRRRQSRERQRRRHLEMHDMPAAADPAGSGDGDLARRVHQAVLRLPERERLAIQTLYLSEGSVLEAQTILKVSRSGLRGVLGRAKSRLRRWLRDEQTRF